jgi:hypothetical protein
VGAGWLWLALVGTLIVLAPGRGGSSLPTEVGPPRMSARR